MDTMDCDIASLSACHLLLGRPCQFDLDTTHDDCFNNYSFVHKGIQYMLEPMLDSAIKAEVFAPLKVKEKAPKVTPKLRTALLREGENDTIISTPIIIASVSDVSLITGAQINKESSKEISKLGTILLQGGKYNVDSVAGRQFLWFRKILSSKCFEGQLIEKSKQAC
jgi:hypothetical protein